MPTCSMLLFFTRFFFGFALSLIGALLLALATWLCLRLIAIMMRLFSERRAQDAASAAAVLAVTASALATLYAVGNALHAYLGTWSIADPIDDWLAGPRLISPEAILGALLGLGGLAASPSIWRWYVQWAETRGTTSANPASSKSTAGKPNKSADKPARSTKSAAKTSVRAASKPEASPSRATIPQLGWLALFLLAIGSVLLAFAAIIAPVAPAGNLSDTIHDADRFLPIYACALVIFGCGLLCLLLWRLCRRTVAIN